MLRLDLPTPDVQQGLKFRSLPRGRGVAVVVDKVLSPALSAAGVVPGQQLLGISDPIQQAKVRRGHCAAVSKMLRTES